ncbi:hypothetical protein Ciccas_007742 [Cichlidogyrus casuarinus]|uniref:Uncharacterized protein n=1 Tax=Cichlidogyrus casuarinus TaxID=1844966 RepID=A0ABD2Q218_9PLAT
MGSQCSLNSDKELSISEQLANRPYWRAIVRALEIGAPSDYEMLAALCLLIKMRHNPCTLNL